jgi:2-methylisocitrate lyase-like PEP mutase family enzyme
MTTSKKATTALREAFFRKGRPIFGISAPTPFGAKLLERAGFEYLFIGGDATMAPMLDIQGTGEIDMTTSIMLGRTFAQAVSIPIVMDVDVGFGGPTQVAKIVREYIRNGIAGIRIEDGIVRYLRDKVQGGVHDEVTSPEEMVLKVEAASDARNELDPDFLIIARSDCHFAEGYRGVDEVIERARAYNKAGADVLFTTSATRAQGDVKEHLRKVVQGVAPMPVSIPGNGMDVDDGAELGVAEIRYPYELLRAMHSAGWDHIVDIKNRGVEAINDWRERNKDNPYRAAQV